LYATNGSTAGTIKLAGAVENFKVVAENALFFVQNSATADAALWYSDGTSAGTRFVEALPANFNYDMENAVAITTVGVAAP
jgi:ELWxxDGT repeat protein